MEFTMYFTSSIGKKQLMAITGLGLIGFVLMHLLGNLLLFVGPKAFNLYAHTLTSNPLLIVAELGLLGMFLAHMVLAAITRIENRAARPERYYKHTMTGRGATLASRTMPFTGFVLLIFVIVHLLNFKYGAHYEITHDGIVMRDIYKVVVEYFAHPLYVLWYVFCMLVLALHTGHGLQSALQSLGFHHPAYTPKVKVISTLYGCIVFVGFSALAVYCYLQN